MLSLCGYSAPARKSTLVVPRKGGGTEIISKPGGGTRGSGGEGIAEEGRGGRVEWNINGCFAKRVMQMLFFFEVRVMQMLDLLCRDHSFSTRIRIFTRSTSTITAVFFFEGGHITINWERLQ